MEGEFQSLCVVLPSLTFGCKSTQNKTVSVIYFGSDLCLLNVQKMQHSGKNRYDFIWLRSGSFFLQAVAVLCDMLRTKSATTEFLKSAIPRHTESTW